MPTQPYDGTPEEYRHLLENGYEFNFGDYFSRGWEIFKANWTAFFGYALLVALITIVVSFIPIIGSIAQLLVSVPLAAGFFIVANRVSRNEPTEFGDFFKGFEDFAQLVLYQLVVIGIVLVPLIIAGVLFGVFGATGGFEGLAAGDPLAVMELMSNGRFWGIMLIAIVPIIYLAVSWSFSVPFIVLGRMKFWDAMETSRKIVSQHWFGFFALYFVIGLLAFVGVLALVIGVFVVSALQYCIIYAAFEQITGIVGGGFEDQIGEIGSDPGQ